MSSPTLRRLRLQRQLRQVAAEVAVAEVAVVLRAQVLAVDAGQRALRVRLRVVDVEELVDPVELQELVLADPAAVAVRADGAVALRRHPPDLARLPTVST